MSTNEKIGIDCSKFDEIVDDLRFDLYAIRGLRISSELLVKYQESVEGLNRAADTLHKIILTGLKEE